MKILVSVLVVFNFKNAVGHTFSRQNKQTNKQTNKVVSVVHRFPAKRWHTHAAEGHKVRHISHWFTCS